MPNISLGAVNTIALAAASGVYRLSFTGGASRSVDVLNMGTGTIFVRSDGTDPTVNDPASLALPGNFAANGLTVDGLNGMRVIAAADTTITVKAE